jgi:glycosyltransferase involved in cell wall biosynthesis
MSTVSFIIPIKNEIERLDTILSSLRNSYPNERVVIFSNDTDISNITKITEKSVEYNCELSIVGKTYSLDTPAKVYREIFRLYNLSPTDFLFKIDTDSLIYHPIQDLENYKNTIFGTIHNTSDDGKALPSVSQTKIFTENLESSKNYKLTMPTFVNAVIGFHSTVIQKFIDSKIFENDSFFKNEYIRKRGLNSVSLTTDNVSIDFVLGIACKKLNITFKEHPEIYSVCYLRETNSFMSNTPLETQPTLDEINDNIKYAFVHPVNRIK